MKTGTDLIDFIPIVNFHNLIKFTFIYLLQEMYILTLPQLWKIVNFDSVSILDPLLLTSTLSRLPAILPIL